MSVDELLDLMPGLYRAAVTLTRNSDEAEELVQEICSRRCVCVWVRFGV
ncbi:MAG: hypothetical protein LBC28_00410 [Oscillospiraceae bacterium]|jgi:DNA-directed RNA polymerase specialized sigma24 family protein|nr:hypothetical protein [Oscillospiraceae bacterium]